MRLRRLTNIRYATQTPPPECQFEASIMPISDEQQVCKDFQITTKPCSSITRFDSAGGTVHSFSFSEPIHEFSLEAEAEVDTRYNSPFTGLHLDEDLLFYQHPPIHKEWKPYLVREDKHVDIEIDSIINRARLSAGVGVASFVISLTRLLNRAYDKLSNSPISNTATEETSKNLNIIMLRTCRRLKIPARYVNGIIYLSETAETERMQGWVECILPDSKFHGFDLVYNQIVNDRYIKLHTGISPMVTQPLQINCGETVEYQLYTLSRILRLN